MIEMDVVVSVTGVSTLVAVTTTGESVSSGSDWAVMVRVARRKTEKKQEEKKGKMHRTPPFPAKGGLSRLNG